MKDVRSEFLKRLSFGRKVDLTEDEVGRGVVETLARVYEKARNALEYRADHLVRRAAIERILKRYYIFDKNPNALARHLMTELSWARYVSAAEMAGVDSGKLSEVLAKYVDAISNTNVSIEWAIGVASAQIEEILNIDDDYRQFTSFAFQVIRQKIKPDVDDLDLLVVMAVEKVYAQSDEQRRAYHVLTILNKNWQSADLAETWRLIETAKKNPYLAKIENFSRIQMPPLLLLRDIYFANPSNFRDLISEKHDFEMVAKKVLESQMSLMSKRIATAATRSIVYVFLTKMIFGIAVEVPVDLLFSGSVAKWPLLVNLFVPVSLMWATTWKIKLPGIEERRKLVERTWKIVDDFSNLGNEMDNLNLTTRKSMSVWYFLFSGLYLLSFGLVFWAIFYGLGKFGFNFVSRLIFVFFVCVVAFFSNRISQTAKIYRWIGSDKRSSLLDIVWLPILTVGSKLSQGLSRLNFLAFAFDFVLEAPFKLILRFLDNWVQFLHTKKEEVSG